MSQTFTVTPVTFELNGETETIDSEVLQGSIRELGDLYGKDRVTEVLLSNVGNGDTADAMMWTEAIAKSADQLAAPVGIEELTGPR